MFRIDVSGKDSDKSDEGDVTDEDMRLLGGGGGNPSPLPAGGGSPSVGGIWDSLLTSIKNALSGLDMAMGEREGIERHHFLADKNRAYKDDFSAKSRTISVRLRW